MSVNATCDAPVQQRRGSPLPIAMLGLVFDPITLEQACSAVKSAVRERRKLVFATPNVNFTASAARNSCFREQVLHCQLSLMDGTPLVWLGRLLGLHIPCRVAGSSLFEALRQQNDGQPLRVFFFGGDPGVAKLASEAIGAEGLGMSSAGYLDPGRGSVEDMSADDVIGQINAANPDFLCVALGAVKGHAWIERNAARLRVPVISHLGAVVNFAAGRISRAPRWMQNCGLEWAWRILKEPKLARRYIDDGLWLLKALFTQLIPAWLDRCRVQKGAAPFSWSGEVTPDGEQCLRLCGDLDMAALLAHQELRQFVPPRGTRLLVDMENLTNLDSYGIAWLLRLCHSGSSVSPLKLQGFNNRTRKCLRIFGAGFLIREFS